MKRFFLVDCNNFFVSCERVFDPMLRNKPVVVLSSGDACVIARSNEAKALGIPMGAPAFKFEHLFKKHNVLVYSANFTLYGDMSARMMQSLTRFATDIEIYSVDEAFLFVSDYPFTKALADEGVDLVGKPNYYTEYARFIRTQVKQATGIPVSIGIGPTKTLAKVSNYIAKKFLMHDGVFDITERSDADSLLGAFPVEEIWGIGYQYAKKLINKGIKTAKDFKYCDEAWVRKNMTVVGHKTLLELRGISCISLETIPDPKQSVTVSRLFGHKTSNIVYIKEALASYVACAAQKLREQNSLASHITVFIVTNRYHDAEHFFTSTNFELSLPTSYTPTLITAANACLEKLFIPGFLYKKVGVILSDLVHSDCLQLHTQVAPPDITKQATIMRTMDKLNDKLGRNKIFFAAAGIKQPWKMKQMKKSQCFTTSWHELLTVKV